MKQHLEANPFASTSLDGSSAATSSVRVDFAPILHRWEKYRLWYNGTLVTYTMAWSVILTAEILLEPLLWFQLVFLGTVCNVFFFLGPALEAYGRYFGVWSKTLSLLLFLVGLFVTGLLATGFLIVRAQ